MKKDPWYVYIIETENGLLYTGITNDLVRRFKEHSGTQKGRRGAKFFNFDLPKWVVYVEEVKNRSEATKKEILIKKMTKLKKQELLRSSSLSTRETAKKIGLDLPYK